jgi:hypothetical protein
VVLDRVAVHRVDLRQHARQRVVAGNDRVDDGLKRGPMLWSLLPAISSNFLRKMAFFLKTNVMIRFCEKMAVRIFSRNRHFFLQFVRWKYVLNRNIVPR